MEIDQKKRLHGPWHYDEVIDGYLKEQSLMAEVVGKFSSVLKRLDRSPGLTSIADQISKVDKREVATREKENFTLVERVVSQELARCRAAHPFLIGPATLDALLKRQPEKWDYVENGQLPFNDLFFDMQEPWEIKIPFDSKDRRSEVVGVSLHKPDPKIQKARDEYNKSLGITSSPSYTAVMHYRVAKDCILPFGRINMNFDRKTSEEMPEPFLDITGECGAGTRDSPKLVIFRAIPDADLLIYADRDPMESYKMFNKTGILDPNADGMSHRKLSEIEGSDVFSAIPNLMVNLVNYINAHNVQVVSRARKPRKTRFKDKFIEEPSSNKPFHVIVVKSGQVEENREGDRSYTLNFREAVRGHDRHYRNPDGSIRLVAWVEPYIRGPENAPWRETRYDARGREIMNHQDLGDKILRERQMRKELGME